MSTKRPTIARRNAAAKRQAAAKRHTREQRAAQGQVTPPPKGGAPLKGGGAAKTGAPRPSGSPAAAGGGAGRGGIRRKDGPLLLVLVIIAVAIMAGLGVWQVQRLAWKADLIETRQAQLAADPVPLPVFADDATPEALQAWAFRRVEMTGRFLHDKELYQAAKSLNGNSGYHILTPFERTDLPGGTEQTVLVSRGWVPLDNKAPETRAAGQIAGITRVTGIARVPATAWIVPDNRPSENFWFTIDLTLMGDFVDHKLAPVYVEADDTPVPGDLPRGGQTRSEMPNDHLQYAITWFALALSLIVIYVVYRRRR